MFKKIFYCLIYSLLTCAAYAQKIQNQKPNIIFILTDDLGYGDLGVFFQQQRAQTADASKPFELTPQLDKMAENGVRFTDQYCNAPVCAPSRASFITGVNQGNVNVRDNQFDKAIENNFNIPRLLKQNGYTTALIGKWGLQGTNNNWEAHPLKRGFDYFYGYMRHSDGHEHYPFEGLYRGKKEVWENYKNVAAGLEKSYTTDLWTARAKQWIVEQRKNKSSEPFFMFLAYDAPHAVLELPTQAYPAGGGLNGGVQWLNKTGQMINTAAGEIDTYIYPEYANAKYDDDHNVATPKIAWPDTYKRYATANRRIDDGVGDILQLLKDLKIEENTLVVFTSDNGSSIESYLPKEYVPNYPTFFGSNGPFDGIKRDCWEGGLRVPTIVQWKGKIKEGIVSQLPSMLSDWLPTFAEAAQLTAPARTDGVSLLPTLTGKGIQLKPSIYVEYYEGGKTPNFVEFEPGKRNRQRNQMQMLRLDNYVGVRYNIKSAEDDFEIYDVLKDPKQTTNLAKLTTFNSLQEQFKDKALQIRKVDAAAKRPYDNALIPAIATQKKLSKGIEWRFFANKANYVINVKGKQAQSKGVTKQFSSTNKPNMQGTTVFNTLWKVEADGKYLLKFSTKQKAYVRLHDATLFDADYDYQPKTELKTEVYLKKGCHPITISLKSNTKEVVDVFYCKDGENTWNKVSDFAYRLN